MSSNKTWRLLKYQENVTRQDTLESYTASRLRKIVFVKSNFLVGVADLDYEFSIDLFEKSNLKLIFGYVQNHHSYLDSATPSCTYPGPEEF